MDTMIEQLADKAHQLNDEIRRKTDELKAVKTQLLAHMDSKDWVSMTTSSGKRVRKQRGRVMFRAGARDVVLEKYADIREHISTVDVKKFEQAIDAGLIGPEGRALLKRGQSYMVLVGNK